MEKKFRNDRIIVPVNVSVLDFELPIMEADLLKARDKFLKTA